MDHSVVSRLQMTVKTHKPPGLIAPRQLHCSPLWGYEGLARRVALQLRSLLADRVHLVKDSRAASRLVNATVYSGEIALVKLDVKDFFLAGSVSQIVSVFRDACAAHPLVNLICDAA